MVTEIASNPVDATEPFESDGYFASHDGNSRSLFHVSEHDGNTNIIDQNTSIILTSAKRSNEAIRITSTAFTSPAKDELDFTETSVIAQCNDEIGTRNKAGSLKSEGKANRKSTTKGNNEKLSVKCCIGSCKELFENIEAMMRHVATYHKKGIKNTFSCYECKKTLSSKQKLQLHMNSVHMGLKPFKCSFPNCLKSFSFNGNLKKHTNAVHTKSIVFRCRKCPKKYYYKSLLTNHLAHMHGKGNTYFCYLCKKKFTTKWNVKSHMNAVHTHHIRFQCPIRSCSKIFTLNSNLKQHINAIHTETNAFTCTQ